MADRNINVTGVTRGQVGTSNVAGVVDGGMGNRMVNTGDTINAQGAQAGQIGRGGTAKGTTFGGSTTSGARAPLSAAQLLEEVRKAEVSDATLKIFSDSKITGAVFLDGDLKELLEELSISNAMDKKKLNILRKNLEGN